MSIKLSPDHDKIDEDLFGFLVELAKNKNTSAVTIMRFSTGWKVVLGTPDLDIAQREFLFCDVSPLMTLSEAMNEVIKKRQEWPTGKKAEKWEKKFWKKIDAMR
jgi:hypothetical protein